jgi:hypothetical protein
MLGDALPLGEITHFALQSLKSKYIIHFTVFYVGASLGFAL